MRFPSLLRSQTRSLQAARSRRPRPALRRRRAAPVLHVEPLEQRWCPSYSLITSRAALAGTDSVNWSTLGTQDQFAANPFTILSTSGLSVAVSKTVADEFETMVERGPSVRGAWNGNFGPGDVSLNTSD